MDAYFLFKSLHIISFTAWMAGIFYLPRLFVYHSRLAGEDVAYKMFLTMERKLLRVIMNPAMIATYVFGTLLLWALDWEPLRQGWFHAKILLLLGLSAFQGYLSACHKGFVRHENGRPERFYRIINEVPTLLLIGIVLLAVFKPF